MINDWVPHPKQAQALERPEYEVLFGGARGGGKTDSGLVWLIGERYEENKRLLEHPRYRALVIRKNAEDLADWIDRAYRFFSSFGVDIAYKPAVLRFPSGAVIRTGHLKDDQSYTKYMGQEFPRILLEELTQIPSEKRYTQLIASCRSTIPEIKPQIFATTNPGGLGHGWVKKRFVDPSPPLTPFKDPVSGRSRIYIPATVDDNPTLMNADPEYVKTLDALKEVDVDLWKAWRLGDWDSFAGQYFKEWRRDSHVINPFIPDKSNIFVGGMDWGRVDNFAFYIAEITRVSHDGVTFFRSKVFLEVYGKDKNPAEWGQIIKDKLKFYKLTLDDISWIRGDAQMWAPGDDARALDIYTQFKNFDARFGVLLKQANKDRVGGWQNLHNWLSLAPDEMPYLQVADNCLNLIRTLPELVYDEEALGSNKREDVAGGGEDDGPDSLRYMQMSLKWIDAKLGGMLHSQRRPLKATAEFIDGKQMGMDLTKFVKPEIESRTRRVGAILRN